MDKAEKKMYIGKLKSFYDASLSQLKSNSSPGWLRVNVVIELGGGGGGVCVGGGRGGTKNY